MVCLWIEPGTAGWKAQTNSLSFPPNFSKLTPYLLPPKQEYYYLPVLKNKFELIVP